MMLATLSLFAFTASLTNAIPTQQDLHNDALIRRNITLGDCLTSAGIETSLPSSSNWTIDTQPWNFRVTPVPSAVVFPTTEDEVTAALKCAKETGTKVTTLGGNRSFSSMGFGRNDGALVFNLKNLKTLEYDEKTQVLTYGGPVMISEAAGYLWKNYQRTLPHGRCPDVGMTGVAASGFGTLSRAAGTVLDNIVGVRVALANGTIVDADADVNSDVYWAARGAASSVGVVLLYKLQTLTPPSQVVTNYTITFVSNHTITQQDNVDALLGAQEWAQSADNNDLFSIRFHLSSKPRMSGFFYGSSDDFATVSQSLMSYLPETMKIAFDQYEFWASENISTPGIAEQSLSDRRYFYIASVTIPGSAPLDNSTAWQLFSSTTYAKALSDASASGLVDIWGGDYTKSVSADTSAWKHDNNLLLVRWDIRTSSGDVAFADTTLTTMRSNFYKFVDAYKAAGGSPGGFTTYRDEKWSIDETADYLYGDNWSRLQKIKTAIDPDEMFNTDPQAVPALAA